MKAWSCRASSFAKKNWRLRRPCVKRNRDPPERSPSHGDYTLTLAEIVEAQRQIQMRHLELEPAMALVAERTIKITNASGAGIGLLEAKKVEYRAACGPTALAVGTVIPLEKAVCAACFRTGQVVRSENFTPEFLFDPEPIRKRGIESLIAVPIYHDGRVAGALELYFEKANTFVEQDIHTCQLMAGLVTEAFARNAELSWKQSLAVERNTMLEALERLKPELAALAQNQSPTSEPSKPAAAAVAASGPVCAKCGAGMTEDERFCGKCGAARVNEAERSNLQSKLASAWHKQLANQGAKPQQPVNGSLPPAARHVTGKRHPGFAGDRLPDDFVLPPLDLADLGLPPDDELGVGGHDQSIAQELSAESERQPNEIEGTALVKTETGDATWTSAAKAKDFLEALAMTRQPGGIRRFVKARRGDFYLAIAIVLVVIALRWGIWSDHSVGASGNSTVIGHSRKPAPDADLSAFDKLLISLGLADAPGAAGVQRQSRCPGVGGSAHCAVLLRGVRPLRENSEGQIHQSA